MKRWERQLVTDPVYREILVEYKCDRCGASEKDADSGMLIPVAIEVNYGEEFGRRDEYDYCNNCLIALTPILTALGSKSELVNGSEPD